jgi:hypothetical protein
MPPVVGPPFNFPSDDLAMQPARVDACLLNNARLGYSPDGVDLSEGFVADLTWQEVALPVTTWTEVA